MLSLWFSRDPSSNFNLRALKVSVQILRAIFVSYVTSPKSVFLLPGLTIGYGKWRQYDRLLEALRGGAEVQSSNTRPNPSIFFLTNFSFQPPLKFDFLYLSPATTRWICCLGFRHPSVRPALTKTRLYQMSGLFPRNLIWLFSLWSRKVFQKMDPEIAFPTHTWIRYAILQPWTSPWWMGKSLGTETSPVAYWKCTKAKDLIILAPSYPWTIPRYSGCQALETSDVPMWVESHWNIKLRQGEDNYELCVKDILWLKPLDKQLAEIFLSGARPFPPPQTWHCSSLELASFRKPQQLSSCQATYVHTGLS